MDTIVERITTVCHDQQSSWTSLLFWMWNGSSALLVIQ